MRDLSHLLVSAAAGREGEVRLAVVAGSAEDLAAKLDRAREAIVSGKSEWADPTGVAFAQRGPWTGAPVAFLFPGQGSQSTDMLGEAAVFFPEIVGAFETVDRVLAGRGFQTVGSLTYPPPAADEREAGRQSAALASPEVAQPAIAAASLGFLETLRALGVEPAVVAGHSFGELVALHAAGVATAEGLVELAASRGRFLLDAAGAAGSGAMAAVQAGAEEVETLLTGSDGVVIANRNGPRQTVLSGPTEAIARLTTTLGERGFRVRMLPVACGFHSPLVAAARAPLTELASRLVGHAPDRPVYSNVTARPYPDDAAAIAPQVGEHVESPVRFGEMIERMHADGARVFVEVGPGSILTSLVDTILEDRPHLAVACDATVGRGVAGFLATLGRLFVSGVSIDLLPLTALRAGRTVSLVGDRFEGVLPPLSPSTWLVNGNRARPLNGPEPHRLGPGPALPRTAVPPPGPRTAAMKSTPTSHEVVDVSHSHREPFFPKAVPPSGPHDAVVAAFQATMRTFLDVQRETMLSYLGSAPDSPPAPARTEATEPQPVETKAEEVRQPATAPPPPAGPSERDRLDQKPVGSELTEADDVRKRLLGIVQERTGYPPEMLRLDLDLEADLGIDSIKRVEILGSLRDALPRALNGSEGDLMDQLTRARTLGAVIERVCRHLGPASNGTPGVAVTGNGAARTATGWAARNGSATRPEPVPTRTNGKAVRSSVRRMVLEPVDAPVPESHGQLTLNPGGLVLITDDGAGVAEAAANRLRGDGYRVVRVVHSTSREAVAEGDVWTSDLSSPEQTARLVDGLRREGPLCGVLHLLPLRRAGVAGVDLATWSERMNVEVRGLFLLARAAAADLAASAAAGGASLVAATGMGGGFASLGDASDDFFPGHGGIAGLVKTLAREWDAVRARVVDVDPEGDPESLADVFVDELLADETWTEVGYPRGRRVRLHAVESELADSQCSEVVRPGEPILITGGARGITAAVALDLAKRWRPTLLLVGTSPPPSDEDDPELDGLHKPADLKARLLQRLSRGGRVVGPAELEKAYQSVRKDQEIRSNLRALREDGSTTEYAQVDVRDPKALGAVLDAWKARYGPLAGFVHGAGVIQDKLLKDKSPDAYDRVMSTKLDGALNLARLVDPEFLKFAAFFSSVAGRFGNRGQSDYAAANDALNKLAVWLDRRWRCRVVSMIWGPWSGVGMVSDLERHLGRQGLGMIAPEDGRARLAAELLHGQKGEVEVIVAGDLGYLVETPEVVHLS